MSLADVITDTAPYRWINIPQTTDPQDWSPLRPFPGKVYEGPQAGSKETTPHFWHFWSQINSRFSCDHPICITVRGFTVGKRRIEGSIFLTPNGMMSNSNYYGVNYLAHANPTEMTPEVGK